MSEVTRLLQAIKRGESQATNEPLPLVYQELRRLSPRTHGGHQLVELKRRIAPIAAPCHDEDELLALDEALDELALQAWRAPLSWANKPRQTRDFPHS
jgi:hypothetical protein